VDDLNRRASLLSWKSDPVPIGGVAGNDGSCEIKSTFLEVGADNRLAPVHHRLAQSLAKSQRAKSKPVEQARAPLDFGAPNRRETDNLLAYKPSHSVE